MNQWKSAHAVETKARSLADALKGADVFLGLSVKGAVTQDMVKSMNGAPIIFAMANPDPEITPEDAHAVRPDAIVATGRSDYPNQVNNVLGFPYIFRGALDVRATTINEEMKIAAAEALAALAREDVPDEVAQAYGSARPVYGPNYIIPVPFDPRLISRVSSAVAEAAIRTGVARRELKDGDAYRDQLSARLDPSAALFQRITASVRANPKRVVFAEGEEESVIRAAAAFQNSGLGKAILIGRAGMIADGMARMGIGGRQPRYPRHAIGAPGLALYRRPLQAPAAARRALSRRHAHGRRRPQHLWRLDAGRRRCRRPGDRRHPRLFGGARQCAHWCSIRPRANGPSASI